MNEGWWFERLHVDVSIKRYWPTFNMDLDYDRSNAYKKITLQYFIAFEFFIKNIW